MTPQQITVYLPVDIDKTKVLPNGVGRLIYTNIYLKETTGYFFSREELEKLVSDAWDAGIDTTSSGVWDSPNKEQYIKQLLT